MAACVAALLSSGIFSANALPDTKATAIRQALANVPVLELVPTAAQLVQQAAAQDREEVAETVVRMIITKRPGIATAVVESIVKVAPKTAATVAGAAAELVPDQAAELARIATASAPEQARQIAAAVAKRVPKAARRVTRWVVAAAPMDTPEVIESVLAVVPAAQVEINGDLTLGLMNTLARNSRASASRSVAGKIGKKPLPNPPSTTPTQTTDIAPQARSAAVENAVKELQKLETSTVITDKTLQSDITIATINTLNVIGRAAGLTKQDKDSIINSTITTVTTVIAATTSDATPQNKADVLKTTAQVVAAIVSDPGLNDSVRKEYVNFAADAVKSIIADTSIASHSQLEIAIKQTATEVTKVIESVRGKAADEAQAGLAKAQENVNAIKKAYGSP